MDTARTKHGRYSADLFSSWIETISTKGDPPRKQALESFFSPKINEKAVKIIEQLLGSAFLLGMDHAASSIGLSDESLSIAPLPFDEAISFLKNRVSVTKKEWLDLEPKLRFRAFTMARLSDFDQIEIARKRLLNALDNGETFAETWKEIQDLAKGSGNNINPGYWETVYRTTTQTCYNAGRRMEFERNPPEALALIVIEDGRTTYICRPLIGLVLPYSHPFWKSNWPPFHFNCRTTVRGVYKNELSRGAKVTAISIEDLNSRFKAQEGFGNNPLESGSWWMLHSPQVLRGIKYGVITEFNKSENVITDYDSIWKDYSRKKGKNGGWYDLYKTPPDDWKKNEPVVKRLAMVGYKIKVLPEFKNIKNQVWKNPDIYLDGVLSDIKEVESMTKRGVDGRLRAAENQGLTTIVLKIPDEMNKEEIRRGLKGHIKSDNNKIERVLLLLKSLIIDLSAEKIIKDDYTL